MEWASMLVVTCLGAAIAYGSFDIGCKVATLNKNSGRRAATVNNNNNGDDEDKDGDDNNALAMEGFNVNLGFGVLRFGAGLNLACGHTRLGGNYDTVIVAGTPLAVMVSGPIRAPSSGRFLASESKAEA